MLRPVDRTTWKDVNATEIEMVDFVASLENAFGFDIPDEEAMKLQTVGETVSYVTSRLNRSRRN